MAAAQSTTEVQHAMAVMLERRAADLVAGATAVGWKVGFNDPAVFGHFGLSGPVAGYLTSTSVRPSGQVIDLKGWERPVLEVEVAVRVGAGGEVAALAPALELVDINLPFDRIGPILEGNVFHRGVIFGPEFPASEVDVGAIAVAVRQAGEVVASGVLVDPPSTTIELVRRFLLEHGTALEEGHRIIAGSLTAAISITPGDVFDVHWGPLGSLTVAFA